jgi:hypothetical protein
LARVPPQDRETGFHNRIGDKIASAGMALPKGGEYNFKARTHVWHFLQRRREAARQAAFSCKGVGAVPTPTRAMRMSKRTVTADALLKYVSDNLRGVIINLDHDGMPFTVQASGEELTYVYNNKGMTGTLQVSKDAIERVCCEFNDKYSLNHSDYPSSLLIPSTLAVIAKYLKFVEGDADKK